MRSTLSLVLQLLPERTEGTVWAAVLSLARRRSRCVEVLLLFRLPEVRAVAADALLLRLDVLLLLLLRGLLPEMARECMGMRVLLVQALRL